jgi:hypothetical protein
MGTNKTQSNTNRGTKVTKKVPEVPQKNQITPEFWLRFRLEEEQGDPYTISQEELLNQFRSLPCGTLTDILGIQPGLEEIRVTLRAVCDLYCRLGDENGFRGEEHPLIIRARQLLKETQ